MCSTMIHHLIHFCQPSGASGASYGQKWRFRPQMGHFGAISTPRGALFVPIQMIFDVEEDVHQAAHPPHSKQLPLSQKNFNTHFHFSNPVFRCQLTLLWMWSYWTQFPFSLVFGQRKSAIFHAFSHYFDTPNIENFSIATSDTMLYKC